jgi:hypothetical protein
MRESRAGTARIHDSVRLADRLTFFFNVGPYLIALPRGMVSMGGPWHFGGGSAAARRHYYLDPNCGFYKPRVCIRLPLLLQCALVDGGSVNVHHLVLS